MNEQTAAEQKRATKFRFENLFGLGVGVASLSFGGPAGQIAVMHRIIVDEKKLISEERFLHALNYCMLLPGPRSSAACHLYRMADASHHWRLLAGLLFVLPGFVSIPRPEHRICQLCRLKLCTSVIFRTQACCDGNRSEAVLRIGKTSFENRYHGRHSGNFFVANLLLDIPFPVLIVSAGLIGLLGSTIARTDSMSSRDMARVRTPQASRRARKCRDPKGRSPTLGEYRCQRGMLDPVVRTLDWSLAPVRRLLYLFSRRRIL